ncbi:hypothetical protein NK6_2773 [Bradyrhizobium diazoefficiens]|uniref:Uncharacterized protein n=1 Tax=Bradyrhizobium diazoefficiens TaxID=1355477 RepID=A0A0E4BN62_9BRAD|nr:hypothetical protein NK6_2773 [Bradyrhizobium diazoefficiens]
MAFIVLRQKERIRAGRSRPPRPPRRLTVHRPGEPGG